MVNRKIFAALIAVFAGSVLFAEAAERFFMYNLTTATVFTSVQLAPAKTQDWGANQALNDKDKTVDPSERVEIKSVSHGQFDVRLIDSRGRACIIHGINLAEDASFAVHDSDLAGCP